MITTTEINYINGAITFVTAGIVIYQCMNAFSSALKTYERTKSQQILTSVPGVCTAWGILFTFLSIVLCLLLLYLAGDGDNFSIFNITGSIIPAFVTSVIGMMFSIRYSEKVKIIIAKEESDEYRTFGNPAEQLARIAKSSLNTEHYICHDMHEQMQRYHDMQQKANSKMNDAIEKLRSELTTVLQNNDTSNIAKLTEHTQAFNLMIGQLSVLNKAAESQKKSLQEFVNSFTAEFNKYFTSAHSSFEQQMKDYTTTEVKKYTETLTDVGKQMKEISESILNTQKSSVETIGNKVIEELIKTLQTQQSEATKKAIENQKSTLEAYTTNVKKNLSDNTKNISETLSASIAKIESTLSKTSDSINEKMEEIQKTHSETITQTVAEQQTIINGLAKEIQAKFEDFSSKITEASLKPLETLNKETEFIKERVGQICSRYEQAQEAYSNTLQNIHLNNENWEKSIKANSESLAHIESTTTVVSEILGVLKNKKDGIQEVQDEIRRINETISQLQELNSALTKILAK